MERRWERKATERTRETPLHTSASHINNLVDKKESSIMHGSTSTLFPWEAASACLCVCLKPLEKYPLDPRCHQ